MHSSNSQHHRFRLLKKIPDTEEGLPPEPHPAYPFPVAKLPSHFSEYFNFLRLELLFYRVRYTIKREPTHTVINTPRYTTVFGVDTTSYFSFSKTGSNSRKLLDNKSLQPVKIDKYQYLPRPIPSCLDLLSKQVEDVLVNYYASGYDSISYYSNDEQFLGATRNIASLTLDAKRDFLMKHEPPLTTPAKTWGEASHDRINITLQKATVPEGTENYYRYNIGDGGIYRWNQTQGPTVLCK
ncbi:hypothetical protein BGW36DRAFT_417581 [Talaromyces proteolyticus]|uniref:Uncharacterized protein n=1 Tax=Talaromyces proteolyticus TaxID=1131652 RepID=A0AAD4KTU0_9EURO|nr:uncharacterized protein BGW36DRAFT_417581 [Talaromyces proteolyticus]KAH8696416.1 hypothetical protein BGW36DRAFT_417581 [Talaromyces proteolyticus]